MCGNVRVCGNVPFSHYPPASCKAPNQDLKGMDVLCTFVVKIIKIWSKGVQKIIEHIQIKIRVQNPSQEPPASSKCPNENLKDIDVLCTFKIKIEKQNLEHSCTKDK